MKDVYPVSMGGKNVGTAHMERCGLYYHIRCRCTFPDNAVRQILLKTANGQASLGICIPFDGVFGLETRIPVKRIGEEEPEFLAVQKHRQTTGRFIPVKPQEPFAYIQKLKGAHFVREEGIPGISLEE